MRAGLCSGGGSHGSFGLGQAEKLGNNYDLFHGESTGALIAPLWAIGRFDVLKKVYFNSTNKDIFNVYPFTASGNLNIWNLVKRTTALKATLGETLPLKAQIDRYYLKEYFDLLKELNKEVIIGTSNLRRYDFKVEYFSSKDLSFEDFKTIMWASASPPIYGSIVNYNGTQYGDAGTREVINFTTVLDKGATYIDAIIHRTKDEDTNLYSSTITRYWDMAGRLLPSLLNTGPVDAIELGARDARASGCDVNLIYMPFQPDFGPFQFDPKKMQALYYSTI